MRPPAPNDVGEPRRQLTGELPLPAAVGRHRPLQSQRFVTGDEGRFATHGQFQAGRAQPPVHLGPQPVQSRPLIRRVGLIGAPSSVNRCTELLKSKWTSPARWTR